jgi:hypothetical protein
MKPNIVSTKNMKVISARPYSRNHKGVLVQNPSIEIEEGGNTYYLTGKKMMWHFIDTLFNERLPRYAFEDDIFAPKTDTPSMWALLNDFVKDAYQEGNEYLIFYTGEDNPIVQGIHNLSGRALLTELETVGSYIEYFTRQQGERGFFAYRDSNGWAIRQSIKYRIGHATAELIDLGKNVIYVRMYGRSADGITEGVDYPRTIKKSWSEGAKRGEIRVILEKCEKYYPSADSCKFELEQGNMLTVEYDQLLYRRRIGI